MIRGPREITAWKQSKIPTPLNNHPVNNSSLNKAQQTVLKNQIENRKQNIYTPLQQDFSRESPFISHPILAVRVWHNNQNKLVAVGIMTSTPGHLNSFGNIINHTHISNQGFDPSKQFSVSTAFTPCEINQITTNLNIHTGAQRVIDKLQKSPQNTTDGQSYSKITELLSDRGDQFIENHNKILQESQEKKLAQEAHKKKLAQGLHEKNNTADD